MVDYNKIKSLIKIEDGFCILPRSGIGNLDNPLESCLSYVWCYHHFGERVLKLSKDFPIEFKKIKIKDILDNAIYSFRFQSNFPSKLVEIHSNCVSDSNSEKQRKISLIRKIKSRIEEKIKKRQLNGKENPIIAISFKDIAFLHYTNEEDYFAQDKFEELSIIVKSTFIEHQEAKILGVIIYETDLTKIRFIENPLVKLNPNVLSSIDNIKIKEENLQ